MLKTVIYKSKDKRNEEIGHYGQTLITNPLVVVAVVFAKKYAVFVDSIQARKIDFKNYNGV